MIQHQDIEIRGRLGRIRGDSEREEAPERRKNTEGRERFR